MRAYDGNLLERAYELFGEEVVNYYSSLSVMRYQVETAETILQKLEPNKEYRAKDIADILNFLDYHSVTPTLNNLAKNGKIRKEEKTGEPIPFDISGQWIVRRDVKNYPGMYRYPEGTIKNVIPKYMYFSLI